MNCIIVDDDETSRIVLSNLVNKIEGLNLITVCSNTDEARKVMKDITVDLLLLDIEMPKETGVELFESIKTNTDVIFITSQTKHAVRAFENDAIDYLIKPTNLDRLKKAITKAKRRRDKNSTVNNIQNQEYIFIKKKGQLTKVFYKEILYIEATSGYVSYYLNDKKILVNGVLKRVEEKLDPKCFIRVHRSFIVNINKITAYHSESVNVGDKSIPLSRMYRKDVAKVLNKLMV
jgi:DNA-binding LytR/AlgR family response regulator